MKNRLLILIFGILISLGMNAQNDSFLKSISVSMGTNVSFAPGIRLDVGTGITEKIKLRAGVGFLPYSYKFTSEIPIEIGVEHVEIHNHINTHNVLPKIVNDFAYSSFNGQVMVDFFPKDNGIFHLTAGLIFGGSKFAYDASLINKTTGKLYVDELRKQEILSKTQEFPIVGSDGLRFQLNHNGTAGASVHVGNMIKPYLGVGIGRTVPNHRVGVKLELGAFYSGNILVSSNNLLDKNNKKYNKRSIQTIIGEDLNNDDNPDVKKMLSSSKILSGISPSVSLHLTIRIL